MYTANVHTLANAGQGDAGSYPYGKRRTSQQCTTAELEELASWTLSSTGLAQERYVQEAHQVLTVERRQLIHEVVDGGVDVLGKAVHNERQAVFRVQCHRDDGTLLHIRL